MKAVKLVMVNGLDQDRCGLGLTALDDVVGWSVVGINITTTSNNNRKGIIVAVIDEMSL